jgi:hypothetical protein
MNLTKEVKDLYKENYKIPKKVKMTLENEKNAHAHGSPESIL